MFWEYQTIIFEFTKDGLLGDKYVDDQDMQKTLNELGQTGWELVNALLLQDGVLTFLKREIEICSRRQPSRSMDINEQVEEERMPKVGDLISLLPETSTVPAKPNHTTNLDTAVEPVPRPVLSPSFSIEPRYNQGDVRDTGHGSNKLCREKDNSDRDDSDIFGGIRIA